MRLLAALLILLAGLAIWMLEREEAGLSVRHLTLGGTPVTLWHHVDAGDVPWVVVAHGFAGSRQMMRAYAVTLARSGLRVATIDLPGHGRHSDPMTGDVTRLDGATAALTREVVAVTRTLHPRHPGPGLALLGHSMATDIVIRAAESLDPDAVVAISMYSEAVTANSPTRLLILSGAFERRLRGNGLEAVQMIDPGAAEGDTAQAGDVVRRAVAAPMVGHVGVLYAPAALREARDWISTAVGVSPRGNPPLTALWLMVLLASVWLLARPLAARFEAEPQARLPLSLRLRLTALFAPIPSAVLGAAILPDFGGVMAFAPLAVFFAIWGAVQGAILWAAGLRLPRLRPVAVLALALWAFAGFGLALDRYGAAFVPTGPRLAIFVALLPATMLTLFADALWSQHSGWLWRLAARALPPVALLGAMVADPLLGVAFTVIPVTVLFWLVYGTAGGWMARRIGWSSPALVLGLMLAWALAASTPVIAT